MKKKVHCLLFMWVLIVVGVVFCRLREQQVSRKQVDVSDTRLVPDGEQHRMLDVRLQGKRIMEKMGVSAGRDIRYENWQETNFLSVGGRKYKIKATELLRPSEVRFYELYPASGVESRPIVVGIFLADDERTAKEYAFGSAISACALCNERVPFVSRQISDNLLQILPRNTSPGLTEHFVSKNVYLFVEGSTNSLLIAHAFVNACVPKDEQTP